MLAKWLGLDDDTFQRWDVRLALVVGMGIGALVFQIVYRRLQRWWDRRTSLRVWGDPVVVFITTALSKDTHLEGTIWNRSEGGIGMMVDEAFSPGELLLIRVKEAPPSVPWVRVEVKHCHPTRKCWMIGCKFTETVHWDTMVWFGSGEIDKEPKGVALRSKREQR